MIKQTAEIFEILSKGGFISSDSTNPNIRQLYTVIEDNQSELYDFFAAINFVLESGNEYYYFSRRENKVDLERKLAFKDISSSRRIYFAKEKKREQENTSL